MRAVIDIPTNANNEITVGCSNFLSLTRLILDCSRKDFPYFTDSIKGYSQAYPNS
jgi:hypothetical protein